MHAWLLFPPHQRLIVTTSFSYVRVSPRFRFGPCLVNSEARACFFHSKLGTENPLSPKAQGPKTPYSEYQKLVSTHILRSDVRQTRIIKKLQDLYDKLWNYIPPIIPELKLSSSFVSRFFTRKSLVPVSRPQAAPKGLYLYGDVGTGKTMLMDLFFNTLPPSVARKRRVHFHAFMIDVHKRMHSAKLGVGFDGSDPLLFVARDIAAEASVLCFDEFQVTDIADAMILRRLFEIMINFGVVCVVTSNRHPDHLYKNGIQRSSFIPAIELLKSQFDVIDLDSEIDYRRIPRALSHVYFDPLSPENNREITKIYDSLTMDPFDPRIRNRVLQTWGRTITVPESTSKVSKFTFRELCGQPLSASDYLEVTGKFTTIFLLDVPKLKLPDKDMARRFITFIDACYERRTKLFVTSEVPILTVFSNEMPLGSTSITQHMRNMMDDLGLSPDIVGESSMFTGEEEIFAFARACSRLTQMGSKEWGDAATNVDLN